MRARSWGCLSALGAFGLALGPLLDEIGLPPTTFDDAGNGVRLDKAVRLLALAMERTNCPTSDCSAVKASE